MAYPLMEHLIGKGFLYCGKYYRVSSELTESLQKPVDIRIYYETVRVKDGVLLFVEDHLQRLVNSVKGLENFPVNTSSILAEAYSFIDMDGMLIEDDFDLDDDLDLDLDDSDSDPE